MPSLPRPPQSGPEGRVAMSIPVKCPECKVAYRVADEMAGRSIRCKDCDGRIEVPDADGGRVGIQSRADAESRPGRRRTLDDEEPDDSPRRSKRRAGKRSNATTILLIVGGALALGCVLCTGIGGVVTYVA